MIPLMLYVQNEILLLPSTPQVSADDGAAGDEADSEWVPREQYAKLQKKLEAAKVSGSCQHGHADTPALHGGMLTGGRRLCCV
jgi:hypothetical protein